tara:strand:+ start:98 stop:613 length:516 start_codon:yes stop_codon:yes gene_type:complete
MKLKRKLKKITIAGKKEIVPWVERLSYFNQYFPKHTTRTEITHIDNTFVVMRGIVLDENDREISDGVAHKKVNEPFSFQKCQSGALNRALFIMGIHDSGEESIMDEDDAQSFLDVTNQTFNAMVDHLDVDYTIVEAKLPSYKKQFTTQQTALLQKEINKRKSAKAVKQASK